MAYDISKEMIEACKKHKDGESEFVSEQDAEKIMDKKKKSIRKKPLPVALTVDQHEYLNSKGNKAEYMRNLLIVDMANNK